MFEGYITKVESSSTFTVTYPTLTDMISTQVDEYFTLTETCSDQAETYPTLTERYFTKVDDDPTEADGNIINVLRNSKSLEVLHD